MRILICGGRDFNDEYLLHSVVRQYIHNLDVSGSNEDIVIIAGEARGADAIAKGLANFLKPIGVRYEGYKADWNKHGNKAGPTRNQQMIDEGKPDVAFAFPDSNSRGTWDMVRRLKKHKIPVLVYE